MHRRAVSGAFASRATSFNVLALLQPPISKQCTYNLCTLFSLKSVDRLARALPPLSQPFSSKANSHISVHESTCQHSPPTTKNLSSLGFNNPQVAFKHKSTSQIIQSLAVFSLCRLPWLVNNADAIISTTKSIFGSRFIDWIIEKTFYKQFVGGPDAHAISPVLAALSTSGVHAILDYAAEDDVSSSHGAKSRQPPQRTVVARTYSYEDEKVCDSRSNIFMKSIEAAAGHSTGSRGFAAIKVTALGNPLLLERVSNALIAIKDLFRQFDDNGDGFIERESFYRVYKELFTDGSSDRMEEIFRYLDVDKNDKVDYVEFTERVSVKDGAAIASRCKTRGPFAEATLSQEELALLESMMKRVDGLACAASSMGVRLMIDAEHSYFQPAIDAVVLELMRRHNKQEACIYNTYQCYLKDVHDRMSVDIERAKREGYKFGAKLVRGAYMVLERHRANSMGYPSPVWSTLEETHTAYDAAVAKMIRNVRDEGAEVMIASHNQRSIELAVAEMASHGMESSALVCFAQLYGMADHITFVLGQNGYRAYKYLPFGRVEEVVPYLIRRAQENSSVLGGVGIEMQLLKRELWRRNVLSYITLSKR